MSEQCALVVNGRAIRVSAGEMLLDAALAGRIVIPHDCCSGQCETCRVRVIEGTVDDPASGSGRTVLACQAKVAGDASISFDVAPMPVKRRGHVASIRSLSADISEVVVWLKSPLDYRPGQYVRVAFAGFSAREYSPAVTAGTQPDGAELVFHLRRYENGAVSAALGRGIRNGHKVVVKGPFGNAFYRSAPSRLVLVSSGTGWAPIWSLAGAARRTDPEREIVVVASAREARNLYMLDELRLLAAEGPTSTLACCSSGTAPSGVLAGRATQFLPRLSPNDVVYVAGAPGMVEAVRALAAEAGAECYADPFLLSTNKAPLWTRLSQATRNVFRRAATPVPTCKISEPVASVAE